MKQHKLDLKFYVKQMTTLFRRNPMWITIVAGALLGAIVFIIIYGIGIIDPTHTEWLKMSSGDPIVLSQDLKQHYLGWVWFRSAPWAFPIGMISTQAYPAGIPVTFLDSIPFLAIPFKVLSTFLPTNFQYIGIWEFICFILQGAFAAIIIRKVSKNIFIILAGSILFLLSSVLLTQTFFHDALASQWIILFGLALLLYYRRFSNKQMVILWSITFALAVLIHPYFVPMLVPIFFSVLVLSHRRYLATVVKFLLPCLVATIIFWIIGGFTSINASTDGLGFHPYDLASIFQSMGWSTVVNYDTPIISENTMYLGLGVIGGLVLGAVLCVYRFAVQSDFRHKVIAMAKKHLALRYMLVGASFLLLFLIAISPVVRWNDHTIFTYPLPKTLEYFWGVFRSSTRLTWPLFYLIVILSIFGVVKLLGRTILCVVVIVVLAGLQFLDVGLSPNLVQESKDVQRIQTLVHTPALDIQAWTSFTKGKKHMVYVDPTLSISDSYALADVATPLHLTMNEAYYARTPVDAINQTKEQARKAILTDQLNPDTVYVSKSASTFAPDVKSAKILSDNGFYAEIKS